MRRQLPMMIAAATLGVFVLPHAVQASTPCRFSFIGSDLIAIGRIRSTESLPADPSTDPFFFNLPSAIPRIRASITLESVLKGKESPSASIDLVTWFPELSRVGSTVGLVLSGGGGDRAHLYTVRECGGKIFSPDELLREYRAWQRTVAIAFGIPILVLGIVLVSMRKTMARTRPRWRVAVLVVITAVFVFTAVFILYITMFRAFFLRVLFWE